MPATSTSPRVPKIVAQPGSSTHVDVSPGRALRSVAVKRISEVCGVVRHDGPSI